MTHTESAIHSLKDGQMTIQLGGYWRSPGSEQFIHIQDLISDRLTVTNGTDFNGLFGVGYFLNGKDYGQLHTQFGLNWFFLPRTEVSGTVLQENSFSNFSYSYNLIQYPLYVVGKSMIDTPLQGHHVTLDVGLGPNFMKATRFSETALTQTLAFTPVPGQLFSDKTTVNFSVTAGAGIRFDHVFGDAPLECGYRFFYLGQGQFNIANNQVINTLKTGQIYANAAICSIYI